MANFNSTQLIQFYSGTRNLLINSSHSTKCTASEAAEPDRDRWRSGLGLLHWPCHRRAANECKSGYVQCSYSDDDNKLHDVTWYGSLQ